MLLVIQNDPKVPPAYFGTLLRQWQVPHRVLSLFDGEPLPDPGAVPAVIVLGGTMGVHDRDRYPFLEPLAAFLRRAAEGGTPLLGICLGGQLLAHALGGEVMSGARGEKGVQEVLTLGDLPADPLLAGLPSAFKAFQWHNDSFEVPPGAVHLAASAVCPGQAFRFGNAWGVQFHPEVDSPTVVAWSSPVDSEGRYAEGFAGEEEGHRALARRLLGNFLAVAGFSPAPSDDKALSPA